jgi:hypothetical protein
MKRGPEILTAVLLGNMLSGVIAASPQEK